MAYSSSTISSNNDKHLSQISDIRHLLKVDHTERGRVSCSLIVTPPLTNAYGTLHGGAVAIFAELVAMTCVRTVVHEDKDLFLGELTMSYLSAAALNVELEADGCIVTCSRNIMTVAAVEFRVKDTKKVVYTARATFYIMPLANLLSFDALM